MLLTVKITSSVDQLPISMEPMTPSHEDCLMENKFTAFLLNLCFYVKKGFDRHC